MEELKQGSGEETTSGGKNVAVLLAVMFALLMSNVYLLWKSSDLDTRLSRMQRITQAELSRIQQSTTASATAAEQTLEELQHQLAEARNQAATAAGQTKQAAERRTQQLVKQLEQLAEYQRQQQAQVADELGQVKEAASATNQKVTDVISHVSSVSSEVAEARSSLDKTIDQLKSVLGDLGVQSGLIATNSKELAALKSLGERNYFEFNLAKAKQPQKVGNIAVLLKKTDPKRNKYSLDVIADDKRVEKKDKYINEPVQFYVSGSRQPLELVVNEVQKDRIVGYLATPKVLQAHR